VQSGSELGELLLSLRYLPTAGRLTVTVLKARHLRATDVTGQTGILLENVINSRQIVHSTPIGVANYNNEKMLHPLCGLCLRKPCQTASVQSVVRES